MKSEVSDNECRAQGNQQLARLAQLLEHPLRARLFAEIGRRPAGLPELASALDVPLSKIAYHYSVLEEAGGVDRRDEESPEAPW